MATNAHTLVCGSYLFLAIYLLMIPGLIWHGVALLLPALFVMLVIPLADICFSKNTFNPTAASFTAMQAKLLDAAPSVFVICHFLAVVTLATRVKDFMLVDAVFAAMSTGVTGALMFLAAHDLIHRSNRIALWIGRFGLALIGYSHFEINHNRGHHINVGTPADKSTAWRGESAWHYVLRSVPNNYVLSWEITLTSTRLFRTMFCLTGLQIVVCALLGLRFGWQGFAFWIAGAMLSIFLAEVGMFCAHYGVTRHRDENGRYERQSAQHAWDTYHRFSGYLVFGGNRHASHHISANKPYFLLETKAEANQLPFGLPLMTVIALLPPLYRAVIGKALPGTAPAKN